MAVGGTDRFVRLYDRRATERGPCALFAPRHTIDPLAPCPRGSFGWQAGGPSLTHVAFSPGGSELAASYEGDQVYVFDVHRPGLDAHSVLLDRPPAMVVDTPPEWSLRSPDGETDGSVWTRSSVAELATAGKAALEAGHFSDAIFFCLAALGWPAHTDGPWDESPASAMVGAHVVAADLAAAYLHRGWGGDAGAALAALEYALQVDATYVRAHEQYICALRRLGWVAMAAMHAEECYEVFSANSNQEAAMFADLASATHADHRKRVKDMQRLGGGDGGGWTDEAAIPVLNLSIDENGVPFVVANYDGRDNDDTDDDDSVSDGSDSYGAWEEGQAALTLRDLLLREQPFSLNDDLSPGARLHAGIKGTQRLVGHANTMTDIKEVSWLGRSGRHLASGSDDGCVYIWDRFTGDVVNILRGADEVSTCRFLLLVMKRGGG